MGLGAAVCSRPMNGYPYLTDMPMPRIDHSSLSALLRRSTVTALALVLPAVTLLSACSPDIKAHGALPTAAQMEDIQEGRSSKADVAAALGSPSTTSLFDGEETWYYIGSKQEQFAFYPNEELERSVIAIRFDRSETIQSIQRNGLKDGTDVTLVARETPTAGNKMNIFEQLLGNIGKFNKDSTSTFDGKSNIPGQ